MPPGRRCNWAFVQNHFLFSQKLPTHGVESCVWWAHNPTGKALVFVHGFAGQALSTWAGFPSRLCDDPKCAGWDLYFFGYDGRHTEAASSAAKLEGLLDAMAKSPADVFKASTAWQRSARVHPATYERVVLVAHSLGAIVARRAMLGGYTRRPQTPWATKVELFLYAPAHLGARVALLVREIMGPLAERFVAIAQAFKKYLVLRDVDAALGAKGSLGRFQSMLDETSKEVVNPPRANLGAIGLVWKENDMIVTNDRLPPDPSIEPDHVLSDCTHSTVCKPTESFPQPFKLLIAKL